MNSQLTARILNNMPEFSKGQKLIAKYILEHYDKVAYMTASRLGATVGVRLLCVLQQRLVTVATRSCNRRCRK